jgi:hypothetical protein
VTEAQFIQLWRVIHEMEREIATLQDKVFALEKAQDKERDWLGPTIRKASAELASLPDWAKPVVVAKNDH